MIVRSQYRRDALPVVSALLVLLAVVALFAAVPLAVAPSAEAAPLAALPASETRPPEAVSRARVALVRVLTYYNGAAANSPLPIPVLSPCAADGVLVGTTGSGLNSFDYVLVPTAAVSPLTPCQGVQANFQTLYGNASGWSLGHITVLLNVAYTGAGEQQTGTVAYSIDPSQVLTNGGVTSASLLALALTTPQGAHDLPVLSVPQPSDAPATGAPVVLDLTGSDGQPIGHDSVTPEQTKTTLYPVALPASQLTGRATAAATPPGATATSMTSPLSQQIGLGAPEIDANGRLIGMMVPDARGEHVLSSAQDVAHAIGAVMSKPGPLMTQWQQGLDAFYAAPPQFSQAASAFDSLASAYPDFGGVQPYRSAAHASSTTIPSLTQASGSTPVTPSVPGTQSRSYLLYIVAALVAVLVVVLVLVMVLLRRRRAAPRELPPVPVIPPEEARLDLLPANIPLNQLDTLTLALPPDDQPTQPLPAISAAAIESQATLRIPAIKPELPRTRKGLALMPYAAGLTDAGVKRARDPNQDNILAVQGVRIAAGRPQPYGLFVVADGMGGHLNGQEASRAAIEIVATAVLQPLTKSQPLSDQLLVSLLGDAVRQAGAELHQRNLTGRLDMGTTITAALVVDDMAYVVNVGDSRTYLLSPELGLRQITTDHSVVQSLVAAGVIRPEEVYTHPRRNQIYRSLGGEQGEVEVDTFEVPLQAGDKLLLCSDGLWEMVRDPQIASILRGAADPRQAVELLVREAKANGGEDNIGVVVVRLLEDVPEQAQPGLHVLVAPESAELPPSR